MKKCVTKSDQAGFCRFLEKKILKKSLESVGVYDYDDFLMLQGIKLTAKNNPTILMETLEELLRRDKQREQDGFPKKIKVGRVPTGKGKFLVIPSVEEAKLFHGSFEPSVERRGEESGGQGKGEEGEVIGKRPIDGESEEGEGEGEDGGEGGGGEHGVGADAYEYGKKLVEEFHLPNLLDKGKKVLVDEYVYELTGRNRGSGQLLDKKETMKQIIKTNYAMGIIEDLTDIDPSKLIISPQDSIFRILSKEQLYKPRAIVFFGRDYSGSMDGEPTKAIITQHLMLYSWLMFQYEKFVTTRFILHDTEAKEVSNFDTYYRSIINGGTAISSAFELINKIVKEENLASDYNIYVFYGTDGDNSGSDSEAFIKELKTSLSFSRRMGITVARNSWGYAGRESVAEKHIKESGLLNNRSLFRVFASDAKDYDESMNIRAVKYLISEK